MGKIITIITESMSSPIAFVHVILQLHGVQHSSGASKLYKPNRARMFGEVVGPHSCSKLFLPL